LPIQKFNTILSLVDDIDTTTLLLASSLSNLIHRDV
jgi:hypothetical protein